MTAYPVIYFSADGKSAGEEVLVPGAKIFEAGEYPDKLETPITEDDLDRLVSAFSPDSEEVPIKIEHLDGTDWKLGTVRRIWRTGKELFADLAFPKPAWDYLSWRNLRKLSVGILSDLSRLRELSVVVHPRVASAGFGSGNPPQDGELLWFERDCIPRGTGDTDPNVHYGGDRDTMPMTPEEIAKMKEEMRAEIADSLKTEFSDKIAELTETAKTLATGLTAAHAENTEIRAKLRTAEVEASLAEFKRQGKITPAVEELAKTILLSGKETVRFGEEEKQIASLFAEFVEKLPASVDFTEHGASGTPPAPGTKEYTADEQAFFSKMGVDPEIVKKYRNR